MQTLARVLCAVVKFDSKQQLEILEQEERRQNMVRRHSVEAPAVASCFKPYDRSIKNWDI